MSPAVDSPVPSTRPVGRGAGRGTRIGARDGAVASISGLVIGAAAGLIGVGGGEFRIPVLLRLLRLEVRDAAGVNFVVGLCTVTVALARRLSQQTRDGHDLELGLTLAAVSVAGSIAGVRQAGRFSSPVLRRFVCLYLALVGAWMILEAVLHADHALLDPTGAARLALAAVTGFAIAAVSGSLGVAGGEMRIPALMYLFAVPIKEAGTLSLMASIPTVGAGAFTARRLGHLDRRGLGLGLLMGAASIAGVLGGVALLPYVDRHALKAILGAILLAATLALALPGFGGRRGE